MLSYTIGVGVGVGVVECDCFSAIFNDQYQFIHITNSSWFYVFEVYSLRSEVRHYSVFITSLWSFVPSL